jgi:hypothetical protein
MDRNAREDLVAHSRVEQQEFTDLEPPAQSMLVRALFHALTRDLRDFRMLDGYVNFIRAFEEVDRVCFWPARSADQVVEDCYASSHRDYSASPPFPRNGMATLRACDLQPAFDMMRAVADHSHWESAREWLMKNHAQLSAHALSTLKAVIARQSGRSQCTRPQADGGVAAPAVEVQAELAPVEAQPNAAPDTAVLAPDRPPSQLATRSSNLLDPCCCALDSACLLSVS